PGANPKVIKFRVEGADRLRVDQSGNLQLVLKEGEVQLNKPFIYQLAQNGSRREIKGAYAIKGNEVSFKVRGFDAHKPLVIDPVLSYSTFLGTSSSEIAQGIAVDSQGSAYVTGFTDSGNFPTTAGAFRTTNQFGGAFITKLDPTGSSLVYSTYLVGASGFTTTSATAIAVDAAGNAHVTGFTTAADFPVVNGLKSGSNFFKTTDSAANWNNNNTGLVGAVRAIAVAPNALNVVYAATELGPYRSSDGGATWTKLPTTGLPGFIFPSTMAVSPVNSAVVYLGSIIGGGNGLFRSLDGGNTWNPVNLPIANAFPFSIVFDPTTPSTIYVGAGSLFRSTDNGSTWTTLNNFSGLTLPPDVRTIAIDSTTPGTMYAGTFSAGVFKTTNGGANWSPINNGLSDDPENSFVRVIVIDPFNPSTLYSGHGSPEGRGKLNKSTNGGASWTPITNGVPFGVVRALIADQSTTSTLYAVIEGSGVFKTINGGANWTSSNNGFGSVNVQSLVAHPTNSAIMYAGTSGFASQDAFVTKLNSTGSGLLFSTYLGGSFGDSGTGIATDSAGNIYVAGETSSKNFPTVNAFQSSVANDNCFSGFVTKINPAVPSYVFSTYLGGSSCDTAYALALDSAANVYVAGQTRSPDFPTANAFQPLIGDAFGGDAFVTKLTTTGSVVYSTFLGGDSLDSSRGIAVNSSGEAIVAGNTTSSNFPTVNPIQGFNSEGNTDAFVAKFNSQGSALVYSTYLGGEWDEFSRGIAVDAAGNAHVVGTTNSRNFPVVPGALRTRSTLFKSIDGGVKWSNDNYGLDFGINSAITDLIVHPTQPSTIYAGTLSGVYKSTNGGRTWSASNNGLNIPRVTRLLMDPSTPSTLYAAAQEFDSFNFGVYKSTDGGATWNLRKNGMSNGEIVSLAIDPVTPNTLYAGTTTGTQSGGQVFKTTDGADNWAPVGIVPASSFISMAVDSHNHTTIYGAAPVNEGAVFKTVDGGATWNPVGLSQTGALGRSVAVSPHTPGLLYLRKSFFDGIFRSTDGGANWVKVTTKDGDVVFDPVSPSTVYLLTGLEGVLKSIDNGVTWVQLTKGYNGPVTTALAFDPLKPSTLYFSTLAAVADDSFVAKLNPSGSALLYSTFLGGMPSSGDFTGINAFAVAIALDSSGNAYVTGSSESPTFPITPNSFQPLHRGFRDAFIMKLTMSHIISGHVRDGSSAPVSGADVVLQDGSSITQVTTETDGSYEFSHLREGGSYTVSASKAHFTMAPPSQTFNNLTSNQTLNFTATAT
ncbi:MAG TPA: SBBP repeat-containing protein, partial [Pyrinomonadaceae bacterium]|nr:SBBP repeat-containing protein [Pyrinomonadaceae bacterium]